MNFSLCETDLGKFDRDWGKLKEFLAFHGLDGVELFVNHDPLPEIPKDVVVGTHLPFWPSLHGALLDNNLFNKEMEDFERALLYGGHSKDEVVDNFRQSMLNASSLDAAYGVFHIAYSDPSYIFSDRNDCTDSDVLKTTADFLNESVSEFPDGEPPVRIFFENLWWPGLTLLDPVAISEFIEMLEFDNWAYILDTGHLIAAIGNCKEEDCAVDAVINVFSRHNDDLIDRIEGMHFHCGLSGGHVCLPFEDFHDPEKTDGPSMLLEAVKYINTIDPHMPFTTERCREIVDFISPDYLTHEFIAMGLEDLENKIVTQRAALHGHAGN
jgi:hypothetical protein